MTDLAVDQPLSPELRDLASHLVEYPAGSGRLYHRRPDGAVLRVEIFTTGWVDLTCDVAEVSIHWGDTSGDNLTPTSGSGQAQIILRDLDGRFGPLPPTGMAVYPRWRPVRVWLGYLGDGAVMPPDPDTDYGAPGTFGGTPPGTYGGYQRVVARDGISCRFSGWLMSQERDPVAGVSTTWTCGDGMVRLVDQAIDDFDGLKPPAEINDGLRELSPGNYRVGTLVGYVSGPGGESYHVDISPAPSAPMVQSPGGKVSDLVHDIAESDLSFFWWVPAVVPTNHNGIADHFAYRRFDWFANHGVEWLIDCEHIEATAVDLTSTDSNFYSAISASTGFTKRTVWLAQPPFSAEAFDDEPREVAFVQWRVSAGESFNVKAQMTMRADLDFEWWFRFPLSTNTWTRLSQQNQKLAKGATEKDVSISASGTIEVTDDGDDRLLEVALLGKAASIQQSPGHLAEDVWLILARRASKPTPTKLVDGDTVAQAELHEYEHLDLMLCHQADVTDWATWVLNRSRVQRWSMESIQMAPETGSPSWSWGMWHGATLGDRATVEMLDNGDVVGTEHGWLRGLEFRVADSLTLTAHVEPLYDPGLLFDRRRLDVRAVDPTEQPTPGRVFVAGGSYLPDYAAAPELPAWAMPGSADHELVVSRTGALQWLPRPFVVVKQIAPSASDYGRDSIPYGAVWIEGP